MKFRMRDIRLPLAVKLLAAGLCWSNCAAALDPPPAAFGAGYTINSFSVSFDQSSVDTTASAKKGFKWYHFNFFGSRSNPAAVVLNGDGSVTLNGDRSGLNAELATATRAENAAGLVGMAFGGGAYIEADIKFNPDEVAKDGLAGWPAWWSIAAEHLTNSEQWAGMVKGYGHFIEVDFMEYDVFSAGRNYYGANLHDWFGIWKVTCPLNYCEVGLPFSKVKIRIPEGANFTDYHRYGFLWIPATGTTDGRARFYFDRQPVGVETRWTKFRDQTGVPRGQPWKFGVLDQQHLVLILGTGPDAPMTVRSVNVWQSSASENLRY
jgi:hypothetical protein